jgi:alkylation response protein AidB-like acyl-CoA dehydrogenase
MYVDYPEEQKALRQELRAYFAKLITPDIKEATRNAESGPIYKKLISQMGQDGWLAVGWPEEHGGRGRTIADQLAFFEEALMASAPVPFVTLNTVGPALMSFGSEAHQKEFLPRIAKGEIHFAIGYTEPSAGTDLAALSTSAVRDGDDYIINGTKVFTSGADGADYIWLAARTDPDAPKHKGITMFIVDTTLEGFSHAPIRTVGGVNTNMTYYENVRVPASMIVGEVNKGWNLITAQLNHERIGLASWAIHGWAYYRRALDWAREEHGGADGTKGTRAIDDPNVQQNLAEVFFILEANRVLNSRMAWELEQNLLNPALASGAKVYSTEGLIEVCRLLMEIIGPNSLVRAGSSAAELKGDLEQEYRRCQTNTFGGGVNEIQRGLVATFGLGMPRHR